MSFIVREITSICYESQIFFAFPFSRLGTGDAALPAVQAGKLAFHLTETDESSVNQENRLRKNADRPLSGRGIISS
jgi:hypothetical protein